MNNRVEENFTIELSCVMVGGKMEHNSKAARQRTLKIMNWDCEMRDRECVLVKRVQSYEIFYTGKWTISSILEDFQDF